MKQKQNFKRNIKSSSNQYPASDSYSKKSAFSQQKMWLSQYDNSDLSRTIVRQYLYQNNLFKTLNAFQNQQPKNKNKIHKSILIKMLSMTNLVYNNKFVDNPLKSLLDILVSYLRNKFVQRLSSTDYKQTSQNDRKPMQKKQSESKTDIDNLKEENNTNGIKIKKNNDFFQQNNKNISRPNTAKPKTKTKQQEKISNIYQKVNKITLQSQQQTPYEQEMYKYDEFQQKHKEQQMKFIQPSHYQQKADTQQLLIGKKIDNKKTQKQKQIMKKFNHVTIEQVSVQQSTTGIKQENNQEQKQNEVKQATTSNKEEVSHIKIQSHQDKKQLIKISQIQEEQKIKFENYPQIQKKKIQVKQQPKVNNAKQNQKALHQQIMTNIPSQISSVNKQLNDDQKIQKKIQKQEQVYQITTEKRQPMRRMIRNPLNKISQKQKNQKNDSQVSLSQIQKNSNKTQDSKLVKDQEVLNKQQKLIQKQKQKSQNVITKKIQQNLEVQKNIKNQIIQEEPQTNKNEPKVFKMKKKQKKNQPQTQQEYKSKFKFDQNFIDKPLNIQEKYPYQPFKFEKMTINQQLVQKSHLNIVLDPKDVSNLIKPTAINNVASGNKKKNQTPLNQKQINSLKKIVFQNGNSNLPKAWHQGFILSPFIQTFYGLKQIEGGPCGIIAAVQCYFLKHLLYCSKPQNQSDFNDVRRQISLVSGITDMLFKVRQNNRIILIVPSNKNFSGAKLDFSCLVQIIIQANDFKTAFQNIWNYRTSFIGQSNHGVTTLLYSMVMTKTIDQIQKQIDCKQNPLIGHHGHCTQELVNLFITGKAVSNCFDGIKELEDNFKLSGIVQKSQFGFLTIFQTLKYIQVGRNLKNPIFPIWIISKEFHYHVVFGNHYLIAENNNCQKFDLFYFDGLYNCQDKIRLTLNQLQKDEFGIVKETGNIKELPLIEQVLLTKWGKRVVDWNGSLKIL